MTQDVKLAKDDDGIYDLVLDGVDFGSVDGLETAILTSVLTNARTSSGEVPEAYDRRGWVGNLLDISENYELGSELWVISQARLTQKTINKGENFVYNSVLWMISRGIAESIDVEFIQDSTRGVLIKIDLFKAGNLIERYITLWRNTTNS